MAGGGLYPVELVTDRKAEERVSHPWELDSS